MANTTLANLKIGALRRAGNNYNANDTAKLTLAGGIINDVLGTIQAEIKNSHYFLDLANTVNTTASQAYVDLVDTDIIDILNVYQLSTDLKLTFIPWNKFREIQPDTTAFSGVPDLFYTIKSAVNGSGVNIYSLYFIPTPSSVLAIYYDYVKNIRFTSDTADSSYCALPNIFDELIYAMFAPRFYRVISPSDTERINGALAAEAQAKETFYALLRDRVDGYDVIESRRPIPGQFYFRVANSGT